MIDTTLKSQIIPLVSIIMPAYNSSKTIRDSIQSVCHQTYPNWELLIIDDCSEEDIESIAHEFKDQRIRYYRLPTNQGVAYARNKGISEAQGQYLAFLDSEDLWHPRKVFNQVCFMLKYHDAFSLPKELAYYRKEKGSLTSNKWKSLTWTWQVYRKNQKLSLFMALFYMIYYIIEGIYKHYFYHITQ